MGYSLPWKYAKPFRYMRIFAGRILLVHLTCVSFEFNRRQFEDLRQTLDKIVNFIDFVYQNDTKYIILHE